MTKTNKKKTAAGATSDDVNGVTAGGTEAAAAKSDGTQAAAAKSDGTQPAAAKSDGDQPVKAVTKSYAKYSTPVKNRLSAQEIKTKLKRESGWYIQTWLVAQLLQLVAITFGNLTQDCYGMHSAKEGIEKGKIDINAVGVFRLRKSHANGSTLLNKSGHPRRVIVIALDPSELTEEGLLANIVKIKEFLELKENNKHLTKVFIEEDNWNLTVEPPLPLRKLDYYIVYEDILRIMRFVFGEEKVTPRFVEENREGALQIFTAGYIPRRAIEDLGFDESECVPVINVD